MATANEPDECEVGERRLCSDCVGEEFLRDKIAGHGDQADCFYCGSNGKTFSIDEMADEIETAFEEHFYQTSTEPSEDEYAIYKHSSRCWYRDGDPITEVVASAAGIEETPTADIFEVLAERHFDMESAKMGEECAYDSDSYYAEKGTDDREYSEQWRFFEKSLKTEARFFSRAGEATLAAVFEGIHNHQTRTGKPVIVDAGPGFDISSLFRARVFQSDEKLESALQRPDKEIGPPPSLMAPAGRMNARGIAVFYGATTPEIAVAEVRPPVGSRVAVGRFDIVRPIRLLDLEALRSVRVSGSIFDREFDRSLKRAKFLERLSHSFTMPVMPDDEPFDYLVTQAVADYLATVTEPAIDGIIYPSAQSADGQLNVVLFHKASRVELFDLPAGTEISAHLFHCTEDGPEVDYWVHEELPPKEEKKGSSQFGFGDLPPFGLAQFSDDFDIREATLRLDTASLQVHHIERVAFETTPYSVHRHRSEKADHKF